MIQYQTKASIIFDQLTRADQKRVQQALHTLEQAQQITDTELNVRKLDPPDEIYLLAVGPRVRVFFQKNAGMIEVLDIVSQARLDAFRRAAMAAGER